MQQRPRKKGCCKDCGKYVGAENLSNENLCYECAGNRILEAFDRTWRLSHPNKSKLRR